MNRTVVCENEKVVDKIKELSANYAKAISDRSLIRKQRMQRIDEIEAYKVAQKAARRQK